MNIQPITIKPQPRFSGFYRFTLPPEVTSQFVNDRASLAGGVSGDFSPGGGDLKRAGKLGMMTEYVEETIEEVREKAHRLLREISGLNSLEELAQIMEEGPIQKIRDDITNYTGRSGAVDYLRERLRAWDFMSQEAGAKMISLFDAAKAAIDEQIDGWKEGRIAEGAISSTSKLTDLKQYTAKQ